MTTKRYALLTALLLLALPAFFGTMIGVLYSIHEKTTMAHRIDRFIFEQDSDRRMNWFSVPGAPSIHNTPLPPFHLAKLRTSDWLRKLNLTKPEEDGNVDTPIDRLASLENLSRDISDISIPRSNWVYVSYLPNPEFDSWDRAFDQLLQHHDRNAPANGASISYVDCLSSEFLCDFWGAEAPAMVYLDTVLEECVRTETSWKSSRTPVICPVQAKVVQLPFDEEDFHGRRPGVFPSEYEQLISLTEGHNALEDYPVYDMMDQKARDFDKWLVKQGKRFWILDSTFKVRAYLLEFGLVSQALEAIEAVFLVTASLSYRILDWTFTIGWELAVLSKDLGLLAWKLSLRHFGYSGYKTAEYSSPPLQNEKSPGAAHAAAAMDQIFNGEAFPGPGMGANFMEHMMNGFIESLGDMIPEDSREDIKQKMQDITSGKITEDTLG